MLSFERRWSRGLHSDFDRLHREMNRLFETTQGSYRSRVFPPINVYDSDEGYRIRAELPGIDPDSLDITVTRNEVVLKGERPRPERPEGSRSHRRERTYGKFSRAFGMPDNIDADAVEASYANGVLELLLPRIPDAAPRRVTVASA